MSIDISDNSAGTYMVQARTRDIAVGWDITHIDELSHTMARQFAVELSGRTPGFAPNVTAIQSSIGEQANALAEVYTVPGNYTAKYQGVIAGLAKMMGDLQPVNKSGNGGSVRLHLSGVTPENKESVSTADAFPTVVRQSVSLDVVTEVGLRSGLLLENLDSAPGNFGVLSATAEWDGSVCRVHTSVPLSDSQIRLVAAFNLQGSAKGRSDDPDYTILVYTSVVR